MAAHEVREDRHGREDAVAADEREPGAAPELEVFADGAIARVLVFRRGPDQPAAQQELDARLQVRQVRHRDQQLAAGPEHAEELGQRARLFLVGEVLEHVEAQRAIERRVGERQRGHRAVRDARGRIVGVDAGDVEASGVFLDQHAFAASGVEHARRRGQRVQITPDRFELRDVGRVVVPGGIERAMVIPSRRVLATANHLGAGHRGCSNLVLGPPSANSSREPENASRTLAAAAGTTAASGRSAACLAGGSAGYGFGMTFGCRRRRDRAGARRRQRRLGRSGLHLRRLIRLRACRAAAACRGTGRRTGWAAAAAASPR